MMNARIQSLLVRLAEDETLRARFVADGRAVMDEAGLEPAERAEVIRHVDVDGRPHAASIVPTEEMARVPGETAQADRPGPVGSGPRY
jgi:hypothetical protein